jgi:hypothetical protein
MAAVVALGRVMDALTDEGRAVPEAAKAEYAAAKALVVAFSATAEQALEDEDEDEEDGDE